jgi:hypothetical protein
MVEAGGLPATPGVTLPDSSRACACASPTCAAMTKLTATTRRRGENDKGISFS